MGGVVEIEPRRPEQMLSGSVQRCFARVRSAENKAKRPRLRLGAIGKGRLPHHHVSLTFRAPTLAYLELAHPGHRIITNASVAEFMVHKLQSMDWYELLYGHIAMACPLDLTPREGGQLISKMHLFMKRLKLDISCEDCDIESSTKQTSAKARWHYT
ncbi:hypothetical protein HD806DRAFT_517490 [Xylariaceae sp. AK1471]|nr:hypothetical protein HD806DRAFT_517490 [Xylariaceae sp. AK1471]